MSVYDSNHKAMVSTFMGVPESFYCQQQLNWMLIQWQSTGRHTSTTKVNFCTGLLAHGGNHTFPNQECNIARFTPAAAVRTNES